MIEVDRLTVTYGSTTVVKDASFSCRPGTVTGFLGPNGAGKSTTMRVLCGLTRATSGTATVNGMRYGQLRNPAREIGVLLDPTTQHSGRTGRENLTVSARMMGVTKERVEDMLELVGLGGAPAARRVGEYSLGMRQRLGLAHALLGEPNILVLDEPVNGLDPEGIHWMRGLLREFADGGGIVLLSSHLLREVDAVADSLVLIQRGEIIAKGNKTDLLTATGTVVRAVDQAQLSAVLSAAGIPATRTEDHAFIADAQAETVGRAAAEAGVVLLELRSADSGGLEEMFLAMTRDTSNDDTSNDDATNDAVREPQS
ncbi:ABC transporter ATP-binding protein [Streptomyces boncukensis]|uniref:ATP-binding cassette domain-containing protein n=1 Tax=Streptomyces boncukensis TaxID=2711219 RepID=A0A6G4WZ81_9ACTN|nr:ATP-binding cassette domain-containing protein [Streptomyces boncukensis]NGO69940.1 ATP-binding cassette domain-containing protein [Streptomyces boncukensis]